MKFAIAGSGGTGGVLGAYLAKAGNDVTFLARGKHLEAIREKGLTLESQHNGNFTVYPAKACTMDEYADRPDVLLVCVKYYDIEAAIELARRTAGEDTIVLPILNVYGTGGVMQDALPDKLTVLDGCMYVFGMIKEPGVISQPQSILRVFYGFRQGQDRRLEAKARALEQVFKAAGIEGHFTDNIAADHLQKFSFVSPMGAAGLYFNAKSEDFQKEGQVRDTFVGLIREVQAIGDAMGLTFKSDLVKSGLKLIDAFKPGGMTSMQRDVAAGRQSEFAGLVDSIVELGKKLNVPTPYYAKISQWGKENHIK